MGPVLILLFGIVAYLIAMASIAYAIGFVGNYWVPKSIDSGSVGPLGEALVVNVLLLGFWASSPFNTAVWRAAVSRKR